jgi:DNA repair protein RadC
MNDKRELVKYMAQNKIYPMISKKGNVFLRSSKVKLSKEEQEHIIKLLDIKDRTDCLRIREQIKRMGERGDKNVPIKEWIEEERPREMLLKYGAERLPISKLLAIILRTGKEGVSAEELSKRILNKFKTLRELDSAPITDLCKIEGVGIVKAVQIKAAFELGKRLLREEAERKASVKSPKEVIDYVIRWYFPYLRDAKKEFFYVVLVDTKNHPLCNLEISKGGTNTSIVEPKEIIKEASIRSASGIILVHNHPSGDPYPSSQDIDITNRIKKACEIVGVRLLDHIIIGKNKQDYFSFYANGFI